MSLKYDPKSHQILTAAGVKVTSHPAESIILLVAHTADVSLHMYIAPHTPSIKVQLNRKHCVEAFKVKTVLNFGCFSAFFSLYCASYPALSYKSVCLHMEQS